MPLYKTQTDFLVDQNYSGHVQEVLERLPPPRLSIFAVKCYVYDKRHLLRV
jgi:hypothetical protein